MYVSLLFSVVFSPANAQCTRTATYYPDVDRDGYGTTTGARVRCYRAAGYVGYARRAGDCNDRSAAVRPGAVETCDGVDNDCSGVVDGADAVDAADWYPDVDMDGYGTTTGAVTDCADPPGSVANDRDCDDDDAYAYPGAPELCDGADNDCDAVVDETGAIDASTWYVDNDGDGFGAPTSTLDRCEQPLGYAAQSTDCDDLDLGVFPGAPEVCDTLDNDCDGVVDPDDADDATLWFVDADDDSYGDPTTGAPHCEALPGTVANGEDCDDADAALNTFCPPVPTYAIAWGDPHTHTGLSHDGCEDPTNNCESRGFLPGDDVYANAAAVGLDFMAITDHSEYLHYQRAADGVDIDIWTEQQALTQAADGGPVLPLMGYEYTAPYGHRTVLFDTTEVCDAYRKGWSAQHGTKTDLGYEVYTENTTSDYATSTAFEAGMIAAESTALCAGTRWISYFHHPAYRHPSYVDWTLASNDLATDTVVEIMSEHGSSECASFSYDGCDFRANHAEYRTTSSVQRALQLGYKLGFVGGTDSHESRPGTMYDGPGYVGQYADTDGDGILDTPRVQFEQGSVTGVLYDGELTREAVFDAIYARHTVASTWLLDGLRIHAYDAAGNVYLPGDDVPAGALTLVAELTDPAVTSWYAEIVDPNTGDADPAATFTVAAGAVRYARIRAFVDGEEQRVWASPFFGF